MGTSQVLHMNSGDGEFSYANNSTTQRNALLSTKAMLVEAIQCIITRDLPAKLMVADLGCSSGPNTLLVVSMILEAIQKLQQPSTEIVMHLNDLAGNDFNNIFRRIPEFYKKMNEENGGEKARCFIAGVPGSFYDRLFPEKSLHLVYSSFSLHWLSQVPRGLCDKNAATYNKCNVTVGRTSPYSVYQAYFDQFKTDFTLFLRHRAVEVVSGGRMILTVIGRKFIDPFCKEVYHCWDLVARALMDLVDMGLIKEEQVCNFNVPFYESHMEEVRGVVEEEGSFEIQTLQESNWNDDIDSMEVGDMFFDRVSSAKMLRAVSEPLIEAHFGKQILENLFWRLEQVVLEDLPPPRVYHVNIHAHLCRK